MGSRFLSFSATCCLLAGGALPGGAQGGPPVRLSLPDAIRAAWRTSPEVRAAELAVTAAAARVRQAGAWPNPVLLYGLEQANRDGFSSQQDILAVEQRVELGAGRSARAAAARSRHEAAAGGLEAARHAVRVETTRAYYLAVAADRRLRLLDNGAATIERASGISERRLAAGDVSGYAHRRLRLEATRFSALLASERLAARSARLALASLVSASADAINAASYHLVDSMPDGAAAATATTGSARTADSLVALALVARPDLVALEQEVAAARADARAVAASRTPTPAFTLGLKRERVTEVAAARGLVAGLALPLPLWDRRQGDMQAWTADADRRGEELAAARRRVTREVLDALESWRAAVAAARALSGELDASAAAALNSIQVAWTEGEVTLVEWLDAVRAYQDMELLRIDVQAQAMIRSVELMRAVGAPMDDIRGETPQGTVR